MKKISDNEARQIELDILIQFRNYCNDQNLRYYLAYGTLIGAVRHKGFIPWDNDVDVFMPRPDYDTLIRLYENGDRVGEYISILDYRHGAVFPFAKLVDSRTKLKEHFIETEENAGIYMDIFPLDGMPDSFAETKKLYRKAHKLYRLHSFANYRKNTGATPLKRLLKNVLYPFSRLVSSRKISEKLHGLCSRYDFDRAGKVGSIVSGFEMERELVPRSYYEPIELEFEGHKFCAPKEYDKVLTLQYGDYMKLPPEEERVVHRFEAEWR